MKRLRIAGKFGVDGVSLLGPPEDLLRFADALSRASSEIALAGSPPQDTEMDQVTRVVLDVSKDPDVRVKLTNDVVAITGSADALRDIGESIRELVEGSGGLRGDHLHFEPIGEGGGYARDSVPLTIGFTPSS